MTPLEGGIEPQAGTQGLRGAFDKGLAAGHDELAEQVELAQQDLRGWALEL